MKISSTTTFGFSILLFGLLLCGTGLWLLLSPAQFQATVKINLEPDTADTMGNGQGMCYDPYFIQTEFETIQSPLVLSNVIESVNLNIKWAKNTAQAIKFLQRRINFRAIPNTTLVDISFFQRQPE